MPIVELLMSAAPAAAGVGVSALTIMGVRNEWLRRKQRLAQLQQTAQLVIEKKQELPEGAVWVHHGVIPRRKDKRTGQEMVLPGTTMLVSNGTPGANRLLDILIVLDRAGLSDAIGSVLIHECDTLTRNRIEAALPPVYHGRTVFAFAPEYPSGFGNMAPAEVERRIAKWSVPLEQAIDRLDALHEERNKAKPGEVVLLTSLGGHAFCGVFIAQELRTRLPEAPIIGIVNLPKKETQRDYFSDLKPRFDVAGVDAWIVSDQMQREWETGDVAVSDIFIGITAASLRSETSPRINNIAKNATSLKAGGMARYEFRYSEVVAHRHPVDPNEPLIGYYVFRKQVDAELRSLIEHVEEGECQVSLDVPTGEEKRLTYDIALAAVHPNTMLDVRDYIEQTRKSEDEEIAHLSRPHLHPHPNYEPVYSVWAPPIDPVHPRCRLVVIRIRTVKDAHAALDEIVKVPGKRAVPQPRSILVHANGLAGDDLDNI